MCSSDLSADSTAFTTYVEGLGTAPTGSGRTFVPGKAWDGQFANGTTVLFTSSNTITLSFGIPLIGLGIDAEVFNAGTYTETLRNWIADQTGNRKRIGGEDDA